MRAYLQYVGSALGTFALVACGPTFTSGGEARITLEVVEGSPAPVTGSLGSAGAALSSASSGLRLARSTLDVSMLDLGLPVAGIDPVPATVPVAQRYCYAINVTGPDLLQSGPDSECTLPNRRPGLGRLSKLYELDELRAGVEVRVPAGAARRFDIVALRKEKILGAANATLRCGDVKFEARVVDSVVSIPPPVVSENSDAPSGGGGTGGEGNTEAGVALTSSGSSSREVKLFVNDQPVAKEVDQAWSDRLIAKSEAVDLVLGENVVQLVKQGGDYGVLYGCPELPPAVRMRLPAAGSPPLAAAPSAAQALPVNQVPVLLLPASQRHALVRINDVTEKYVPASAQDFVYGLPASDTVNLAQDVHALEYRLVDRAGLAVSLRGGQFFHYSTTAPTIAELTASVKVHGSNLYDLSDEGDRVTSFDAAPEIALQFPQANPLAGIQKVDVLVSAAGGPRLSFTAAELNAGTLTYKPLNLALPAGQMVAEYPLSAVAYSTSGVVSSPFNLGTYRLFRCPNAETEGGFFVPVPGNREMIGGALNDKVANDDFCVAKYEMNFKSPSSPAVFRSVPTVSPKTSISKADAGTACRNHLVPTVAGFDLISNEQWQTIARNIEGKPLNWTGGIVGTGFVPTGVTDTFGPLVVDPGKPCVLSGAPSACNDTIKKTKRVLRVVNGNSTNNEIWDFAGNVSEWVSNDYSSAGINVVGNSEYSNGGNAAIHRDTFGPAYSGYNSNEGMGQFEAVSLRQAAVRGGNYARTAIQGGIYRAYFGSDAASSYVGFRCVYKP